MRRREFITVISAGAAWPLAAHTQTPTRIPRIGILSDETASLSAIAFRPFAQGLRDLGYAEGETIAFDRRYAEGKNENLASLAAELVRLEPDVIFAIGTPAAHAAKLATQTIPIVFARTGDPVGLGLVSSLARPGGNLTGLSIVSIETAAKRLELLVTTVPGAKRVGILLDPRFPASEPELKETAGAARSLMLELVPADVKGPDDFEPALQSILERRSDAVIVGASLVFSGYWQLMADLTFKTRLPAMFYRREFVEAGGLMSLGTNYPAMYRRAAAYVDKILRGAKPADLPVEQPTKFEFVVNLKTAKALRLTIPQTLLGRADEVIE
jgi:putative tryptophan/tyrosine transport system substrate-binding protein